MWSINSVMHSFHSILTNREATLKCEPETQLELTNLKSDFRVCFDVLVGPETQKLGKL